MEAHREGQGSMVVQIIGSHGGRRTDFSFKTLREPIKLTPDLTNSILISALILGSSSYTLISELKESVESSWKGRE